MLLTISRLYDSALALLYPQPCKVCGASVESRADGFVCRDCWLATRVFGGAEVTCWKCGVLAAGQLSLGRIEAVRCGRCEDELFSAARSCGVYEKALRAAVLSLKTEPYLPTRLGQLLASAAARPPLDRAMRIIPVPLHPIRQRIRGFNQAEIIGSEVARRTGRILDTNSLYRRVHTERHRAGMDAIARRATVKDIFAVQHRRVIAGETVLLVDDVYTTGATACASAAALLEAGAQEVLLLTIARTSQF